MAQLNIKCSTKFSTAYDPAKAITAITKANPANVTSAAHGLAVGDIIVLTVNGMAELDGQVARVANVTANSFDLEGINTTISDAFVSGSLVRVLTWVNLAQASKVDVGDSSASRVETTRLNSERKEYDYGLQDSPEIKLTNLLSFGDAAIETLKLLGRQSKNTVLQLSYKNGAKMYANVKVAPGGGFSTGTGEAVTQSFSFTQIGECIWFAS